MPPASPSPPPDEVTLLVRQLKAHQIELELQNEELRRARAELEESLGRYHHLFDFAPVGYFTLDREGTIVEVNLAGAALLGIERSRLVGRRLVTVVELEARSTFDGFLRGVLENGGPAHCQVEVRAGAAVRHVHLEGALVVEGEPPRTHCRIAATDISERVAAEAERAHLQDELLQARKMESIGRLAGGIAHDFNNMLAVILNSAEFAGRRLATGEPPNEELGDIREAAERSAALTSKLLAFAARQPVSPKVVELNACIADMLSMLRRLIGEDVELVWNPGPSLWPISIDPAQVGQLLINLAANARNAITGVGKLFIGTQNVLLDEPAKAGLPDVFLSQYVELSVRDTGAGLTPAAREHLFEPFFTTQATGKGTGLGLAMVHGIVRQNRGLVKFESEQGTGTTFRLLFPRHHPHAEGAVLDAPQPIARGTETVLVVEDEPAILRLTTRLLERLGYRVLPAATAEEATRLATEAANEVRLLVTDVIMPEVNGRELRDRLVQHVPRLRCLFISGYTADVIAPHGVLEGGTHFLAKPFGERELSAAVRAAIDE